MPIQLNVSRCAECGELISGAYVAVGGGKGMHRVCYEQSHPPRVAKTLYEMLRSSEDPALAASLVAEQVTDELALKVVDDYNRQLMLQWLNRCKS